MTHPIPEIQRRVNSNARRLKLRVEHHQVFLTIPPRTSEKHIQAFLNASQSWLDTVWQKHYQHTLNQTIPKTGDYLNLPLLAQQFELVIDDQLSVHTLHIENLQIRLNAQNAGNLLKNWVKQQASLYLPQRLCSLAQQFGFHFSQCQIRHAKTRWGSCSATGKISLNAALMLLPVELIDYVILHELCHTRQLNHLAKFWYEMQQVDAHYLTHRQQLKKIQLPAWWHVSG